jgi:hypothetical protein
VPKILEYHISDHNFLHDIEVRKITAAYSEKSAVSILFRIIYNDNFEPS